MWLVNLNKSLFIIHIIIFAAQTTCQRLGCKADRGRGEGTKNSYVYPLSICKNVCIIMYKKIR